MLNKKFVVLIICLIVSYGAGFISGLSVNIGQWYEVNKPSFTPPNYVFSIAWNILFFMIALSLYFAWTKAKNIERKKIVLIFGFNFLLNILWTYFFFRMQQPLLAFVDLIFILITIIVMIFTVWKVDRKSGWLLVPYLLWVIFAGVLNLGFL